jgi:drug/metabolite transporter (DMT)-like permease
VTPVIGGLLAALLWGASTVVASRSTRIIGSQQALAYVMLIGFGVVAVAAAVEGPPVHANGRSWEWAALAGAGSVFGLSMMYRALRLGKVGIVAPIASTEGALAAVFSVAFLGERPTVAEAVALAVIAAGVIAVTLQGSRADVHLRPSIYAIVAATSFGVGLAASSRAGASLGPVWTILVARIVGVVAISAPLIARWRLPMPGRTLWMVAFSALAELIGFVSFVQASRHSVAVPAVLASQFAAVATIGTFVLFGERLGRRQTAGVVVIVAGVGILSLVRAG